MSRKPQHNPLFALLNNRPVGFMLKQPSGAISFRYDESWLTWDQAAPVSLSFHCEKMFTKGKPVVAVLLPDSDRLRQRVAEQVVHPGQMHTVFYWKEPALCHRVY